MRLNKGYSVRPTKSGKLLVRIKVKEGSSSRIFEDLEQAEEWGKLEAYRIRCRNVDNRPIWMAN